MHDKLTQFLRSDTRFTWRTLPAVLRGGFMLQDVLEALKASVKEHGGWLVRGEVVTVPGVTVRTGDLTPRTEPAKEAFAVVAAALKDGVLDEARGLLAIEGGEES